MLRLKGTLCWMSKLGVHLIRVKPGHKCHFCGCGWKRKDVAWDASEINWIRLMDKLMTMMFGGDFLDYDYNEKKICFVVDEYRNFQTFTRTADYPQRSIFVVRGKKVQRITRTGLLPAPQNKRKSCYCITGIRTHKLGAMNIPCCCLQSERSITFSAKNWLLTMQP